MMKDVKMRGTKRPVKIEEIQEFEQLIGTKLPKDYVEHLLKYNGGTPDEEDCFDFIESSDGFNLCGGIHYFYALYEGDVSNLHREYLCFTGRIPSEMIPIASVGYEINQICLGIKGEYYGKVYYWDSEFESEGEVPVYDNIALVANSFTDFINKLYIVELDEVNGEWVKKGFDRVNGVLVPRKPPKLGQDNRIEY